MEEEIDYEPTHGEVKEIPNLKHFEIEDFKIKSIVDEIKKAKNPMLYLDRGVDGYMDLAIEVSEKFNLPVVTSASSVGMAFPSDHPNNMGKFGRLGTKPGNEIIYNSDLILFIGSSHPFARFWSKTTKVIQVNNNFREIGRQLPDFDSVVADSGDFLIALLETGESRPETPVFNAAKKNVEN